MIAFGMTKAVIFLSIRRISEKGMTICSQGGEGSACASDLKDQRQTTHVGDPSEDARVEAHVVLRHVQTTLDEDVALQSASVVCRGRGRTRGQLGDVRAGGRELD